ncbi:MAG: GerMN domain-containing protein [Synechococcaceae cyanobacterium RL_1_2]|nr:GerMN domain-containing protein [Synechococcaceae cyanobacterium RL_1_2]
MQGFFKKTTFTKSIVIGATTTVVLLLIHTTRVGIQALVSGQDIIFSWQLPLIKIDDGSNYQVPETKPIQLYWLTKEGEELGFDPAPMTVDATADDESLLTGAIAKLFADSDNQPSAIPQTTKLNSLRIEGQNIYIDLSPEFGSGGGTTSMTARLGQLIYTLSSFDESAHIWISIEGEPLLELGGEGLLVDQPMTKAIFDENYFLY